MELNIRTNPHTLFLAAANRAANLLNMIAVDVLFSTQLPLANVLDGNRNSMNVYKHAGRSHGEEVNIVPYIYTNISKTTIFSKFQIFICLLFFNS